MSEVHYFLSYFLSGSVELVVYETITPNKTGSSSILLRHAGQFIHGMASSQLEVLSSLDNKEVLSS